ncbi:phosphatidate phosphatase LPIN3 [Gastrophryne carolinensis]
MNYVGKLAGSVLGHVRDLYKGVNPATLSGAIDVIVVSQPDGSFRSSPFHVRFGKLGILRTAEMAVDIEVNGEQVDLQMRLGENGEAFFIEKLEDTKGFDPSTTFAHDQNSFLCHANKDAPEAPQTSPRLPGDMETRRQHWSKKGIRGRGDETSRSLDKDGFAVPHITFFSLLSSESLYFSFSELPDEFSSSQSKDLLTCSDADPLQSPTSRSPSPKSDSELEMKVISPPVSENCMEWDWGRLPQVTRSDSVSQVSQSAPPSPTRDLVQLFPKISTESDVLHIGEEPCSFLSAPEFEETSEYRADAGTSAESPTLLLPDEMLSPESQEVSLYFPNSDPHPPPPPHQHQEDLGNNIESPTSGVALSLCGGLADSWNIPEDQFLKHKVSYSDFCQNPSLLENPNLVLKIHNKYYNWATAAPMLLCMQAFNQDLPQGVIEQLAHSRMPPRSRRWWFSWRRRSLHKQQVNPRVKFDILGNSLLGMDYEEQKEDHGGSRSQKNNDISSAALEQPTQFRKTLRLTSEQIRSLNLHTGANEVVFSICTKFQGTCRARAQIYLWDSTDRIIISDIDGTVTRSDALGHILPQLGKDWTQPGIGQLYNTIYMNDYKFLYCSARSVGLAELTKTFLQGVSEGGCNLPPGPLLLSPSSLFTALHREVIEKTPEQFKIACLSDISRLFADSNPFYAAFGNRPNDVLAYREVGVPESRIFTINPRGELTQDLNSGFKSSYSALRDLVNVMFPPPSSHSVSALLSQEFSEFSYWRDSVSNLSEEELADVF